MYGAEVTTDKKIEMRLLMATPDSFYPWNIKQLCAKQEIFQLPQRWTKSYCFTLLVVK